MTRIIKPKTTIKTTDLSVIMYFSLDLLTHVCMCVVEQFYVKLQHYITC